MFITFWSFQIEININQRQVGEAGLGPAVLPNPTPDVLVIEVGDHDDAHNHDDQWSLTTVLPKPTTAVMVIELDAVFIDFLKDGP